MANLLTPCVASAVVEKTKVVSGGAELTVYESGPAQSGLAPLLFVHAGVCDSRMWARQFDTFAATRRVVAYDRRGFGATAAVDEPFSSVDDLFAVMDALAIERAVLVGCSQGGRIALDATLSGAARVSGLVLVAAAISGAPEALTHDPRLDGLIEAYEKAKIAGDIDEQNRVEAHVWLDGPFSWEGRVTGAARELFLTMNRIILEGSEDCAADVPAAAWTRLDAVEAPTLVLWGPLDVPSVITNMHHAAATIPGVRTCELDGVAHLPSVEAPDRFDAALAAFLRDAGLG